MGSDGSDGSIEGYGLGEEADGYAVEGWGLVEGWDLIDLNPVSI